MGLQSNSCEKPADIGIVERLHEEALSTADYPLWLRCHELEMRQYTAPQRRALMMASDLGVFWGANQVGKTTYLVDDAILRLIGKHPLQRHNPPCIVGIGGKSWPQMAATLKALWDTVDPRWFKRAIRYEGGQLKGQRYAIFDVVGGPGKGGTLCLATDEQGADVIQGWQVNHWAQDEPLSQAFYGELTPRLFRRNGTLRLGFTNRIGTAGENGEKMLWFWEKVDSREIEEVNVPLTLDAVTVRGGLFEVPWLTQAQIDDFERRCTGPEREMRMGRSRIPVFTDRVFTCFGDNLIDHTGPPAVNALCVGVDHGAGAGRQRACAVAGVIDPWPEVWALGEAASDGRTGPDQDAKDITDMLLRVTGERTATAAIASVDEWIGDRYHAGDAYGGEKSNLLLLNAFCRLLGLAKPSSKQKEYVLAVRALPGSLSRIRVPNKWEGSVFDTARQLNELMDKGRAHFRPDLAATLDGIRHWRGHKNDPEKDACDAWRYASIGVLESRALQKAA